MILMGTNILSIPWYAENFYGYANMGERSIINESIDALNAPGLPVAIVLFLALWALQISGPGWGDISYASGGFEQHMLGAVGAAVTYGLLAALASRFLFRRRVTTGHMSEHAS